MGTCTHLHAHQQRAPVRHALGRGLLQQHLPRGGQRAPETLTNPYFTSCMSARTSSARRCATRSGVVCCSSTSRAALSEPKKPS